MKKFFTAILALFMLLPMACQDGIFNEIPEIAQERPSNIAYFTPSEDAAFMAHLNSLFGNSRSKGKMPDIDWKRGKKFKNHKTGAVNYTVGLNDAPLKYLIVHERKGKVEDAYYLAFQPKGPLEYDDKGNLDWSKFSGTMEKIGLDGEVIEVKAFSEGKEVVKNGRYECTWKVVYDTETQGTTEPGMPTQTYTLVLDCVEIIEPVTVIGGGGGSDGGGDGNDVGVGGGGTAEGGGTYTGGGGTYTGGTTDGIDKEPIVLLDEAEIVRHYTYLQTNYPAIYNAFKAIGHYESKNEILAEVANTVHATNAQAMQMSLEILHEMVGKNMLQASKAERSAAIKKLYVARNWPINPTLQMAFEVYFTLQCAMLREQHPEWSKTRLYWEASKEVVHLLLDGAGMIPVVGEIFDVTNGVLYAIEGDGVNATMSVAAAIPGVGWWVTPAKWARKAVVTANGRKVFLIAHRMNEAVKFSYRGQLRKVLNLAKGDPRHAHHIIPWEMGGHELVQSAAKSDKAWHINDVFNGVALTSEKHLTGHKVYTTKVTDIMTAIFTKLKDNGMSNDFNKAYDELTRFNAYLKNLIEKNPNLDLGQIAALINYKL